MVLIEAPYESQIDGDEPYETRSTVEDTTQAAFLARHAGQLSVCTVEEVCPHQQEDAEEIIEQTLYATIVIAALCEEIGAACADEHRPDRDGVWINVEFCKETCQLETEGTDDVKVKPVFCL